MTKLTNNAANTHFFECHKRWRQVNSIPARWHFRQIYSSYRFLWQRLRSTVAPQAEQILDSSGGP